MLLVIRESGDVLDEAGAEALGFLRCRAFVVVMVVMVVGEIEVLRSRNNAASCC